MTFITFNQMRLDYFIYVFILGGQVQKKKCVKSKLQPFFVDTYKYRLTIGYGKTLF